ncbi:copper chaperone [Flavobacterium arcticum]|uniref:Copper chaperone n=1 Tax=Flavobacterium arcticum TaxID=1784713 RepID=A0A345HDP1_9FLAO|nr:heavy-metal-associated domain-containing protein [Flavobacterium arcticum]AXG74701.1 copper chaperone [Flavobacterium arcticum]KAF2509800.1 heavy-metal-associated domain-containing protein [Flavobacterium arcticum]
MNNELKFKTSINCGGCVARVTPLLNDVAGIEQWSVDTDNPDKILTVKLEGATRDEVITTVKKAGFTIEPV